MNNSEHRKYILGTRGSLLALTQSKQVQQEIERISGNKVDLKIITTQGDLNQDRPLWEMEGKDFFTKELDQQLLNAEVDFVVNSYKDLGSIRPNGITLAAITKRHFSHDILLIKKSRVNELKTNPNLVIGTSSPRRIENSKELHQFIPFTSPTSIKTKTLRGNINTRIQKLLDNQYDAIILALAGLERLAVDSEASIHLQQLLESLTFMVLPQTQFPSAASQGALAIECLANHELLETIRKLNHQQTVEEVSREREAFGKYGGGCHLAVGINVKKIGEYFLHHHRGSVDTKPVHKTHLAGICYPDIHGKKTKKIFIGISTGDDNEIVYDEIIRKEPNRYNSSPTMANFYVTSTHTIPFFKQCYGGGPIWTAGTKTMRSLVNQGFWINGCADSKGEGEVKSLLAAISLQMMTGKQDLLILTNEESVYDFGRIMPAYTRSLQEVSPRYNEEMQKVKIFFWTSFFQYKTFLQLFPEVIKSAETIHCCGLGKTLDEFTSRHLKIYPFPSINEFKQWINAKERP